MIGANTARMRVTASSASMIRCASWRKRASSACSRLRLWTSAMFARHSSVTALSEPARRRFSREACLISRVKWRAARKASGATTSASERELPGDEDERARRRSAMRTIAEMPVAMPASRKDSIAATSEVMRESVSPSRRRSSVCGASVWTCSSRCVRRSSRKRSPTHVASTSSPNASSRAEQREAHVRERDRQPACRARAGRGPRRRRRRTARSRPPRPRGWPRAAPGRARCARGTGARTARSAAGAPGSATCGAARDEALPVRGRDEQGCQSSVRMAQRPVRVRVRVDVDRRRRRPRRRAAAAATAGAGLRARAGDDVREAGTTAVNCI